LRTENQESHRKDKSDKKQLADSVFEAIRKKKKVKKTVFRPKTRKEIAAEVYLEFVEEKKKEKRELLMKSLKQEQIIQYKEGKNVKKKTPMKSK